MRFSTDHKFLATGGQDGILRIWEILPSSGDDDHLLFINSEPYREYEYHSKDIVDLSWSTENMSYILTASLDKNVILWNIEDIKPHQIFTHPDIVTSVCFKPNSNIFATGSYDGNVRFWSIQHKKVTNYIDTRSIVTALQFSTEGEKLVSGSMNGECFIFDTKLNKLHHLFTIT